MSFRIILDLSNRSFSGIEALDLNRRFGLPDHTIFELTTEQRQYGSHQIRSKVDEAFARAYFGSSQEYSFCTIPERFLIKGDLRRCCDGNPYANTFAEISDSRARELYLSARFAAKEIEIERLEAKIEQLKGKLAQFGQTESEE